MTRATMQLRIAENLNQLSSDGSTVLDGKVTGTSINNKINDIYLEEIVQKISDKFPRDFYQETYPQPTYTESSTVNAATTGTTLVIDDNVFDNTMEGFEVENATLGGRVKIATYVSSNQVTMTSDLSTWTAADEVYVLGNEYTFEGDTTNLKEIVEVKVKYAAADTYFRVCTPMDLQDVKRVGNESFSKYDPYFYRTVIDVGGTPVRAVGLLPAPDSYLGSFVVTYTEWPPSLNADDEPSLYVAGMCEAIINGVTAWGKRVTGEDDWKDWFGLYKEGVSEIVSNYKPRTRSGPTLIRMGGYFGSLKRRRV